MRSLNVDIHHNLTNPHPSPTSTSIGKFSPRVAPGLEVSVHGLSTLISGLPGLERTVLLEQLGSHYSVSSSVGHCEVPGIVLASSIANTNKENIYFFLMT